jgi:hypothetical protein
MAQGHFQQGANFYEIGEITRNAGISLARSRSTPITSAGADVFNLS